MLVIVLALTAGVSFGALPTTVRYGLGRTADPTAGAVVQSAIGLVVCALVALGLGEVGGDVVPFLAVGLLVPGASTLLLVRAVRDAGPARASVVVNAYPVLSVLLALALLGEPFSGMRMVGALLIVCGTVTLARERVRRDRVHLVGLAFAAATAALFTARDLVVRWTALDTETAPQFAAAVTLLTATVVAGAALALEPRRADARPRLRAAIPAFAPAGVLVGLSYVAMFEAFFRGRVAIVSPLIGTAAFWGVLIPGVLLRRTELVGRHLFAGALLIVAGSVLIALFR